MSIYTHVNNTALQRPIEFTQYVSLAFGRAAREAGIAISMGSRGDVYDNAVAETFFATLKKELVNRRSWPTRIELRSAVFEYIEAFYNRERRHSTLNMLSPINYEQLPDNQLRTIAVTTTITYPPRVTRTGATPGRLGGGCFGGRAEECRPQRQASAIRPDHQRGAWPTWLMLGLRMRASRRREPSAGASQFGIADGDTPALLQLVEAGGGIRYGLDVR